MSEKANLQTVCHATLLADTSGDSVQPEASDEFVTSPYVDDLSQRALAYLRVGYPVHFAGPAGTGKTTLAFHVAAQLGRPVVLIHGDDEFAGSDLVGRDSGYRRSRVVDNYIHSVLRTEESMNTIWEDNRLTTACSQGYTLIYDEFTRSRPEANNSLLSVLEEKILNLPKLRRAGAGLPPGQPRFPGHLHLQSRGIRRGAQDSGRPDGSPHHHHPGPLRPGNRGGGDHAPSPPSPARMPR